METHVVCSSIFRDNRQSLRLARAAQSIISVIPTRWPILGEAVCSARGACWLTKQKPLQLHFHFLPPILSSVSSTARCVRSGQAGTMAAKQVRFLILCIGCVVRVVVERAEKPLEGT